MFSHIYVEEQIADHPRTREITARFRHATVVPCGHYGEIFNRKAQNFRLQKKNPALILARKHKGWALPAPEGYDIGGTHNFYFSHMLNCLYDCRYCFLQGMYRSANYVLFVNYEDYEQAMDRELAAAGDEDVWFFSGYDCDSLALEPVSGFAHHFLDFFRQRPRAWLEIRTKSTQVRPLLHSEPFANCVVAFSFTPEEMYRATEHKVPTIERRLEAMRKLQVQGWTLGLRFDPLLYQDGYQAHYRHLFETVFEVVDGDKLHSVSFGSLRMPEGFQRTMVRLYPEQPLFAGPQELRAGLLAYPTALEQEMFGFCEEALRQYVAHNALFACDLDG